VGSGKRKVGRGKMEEEEGIGKREEGKKVNYLD
jgi:hypothetical protein